MDLSKYISHCRDREYMSGVERDKLRIKFTSEIFTKTKDVIILLDELDDRVWLDLNKKFIDPSSGDGQFLSEVVIRKMERRNCTLEKALSRTYGVEIMEDNVKLCKERLAGPKPTMKIHKILDKNIICGDTLTYDYSFGEPVGVEKWTGLWRAFKQVMSGSREYF